jgi:hypothetical protein
MHASFCSNALVTINLSQIYHLYTSKISLTYEICQIKFARVNGALVGKVVDIIFISIFRKENFVFLKVSFYNCFKYESNLTIFALFDVLTTF